MKSQPDRQPPEYITTFFKGRHWPPNRPDAITPNTIASWKQQQPGLACVRRRNKPDHFRRAFSILGWREAGFYYRCNSRVLSRWVNEDGKDDCLAERAAMKRNPQWPQLKAMMAAYWNSEPRDPAWVSDK
jgi:hypothetical protein